MKKNNIKRFIDKNQEIIRKKTVLYNGKSRDLPVYAVPIEALKYNIQNGRISSLVIDGNYENAYPSIKDKIINQEGDDTNFMKLVNNIIELGKQTEPGVVTEEGILVDGNRRYTALKYIVDKARKENDPITESLFKTMQVAIIDGDINDIGVKELEISIQHGEVGKNKYNPIDVNMDILKTKRDYKFTDEKLAKLFNVKKDQIKKRMQVAEYVEKMMMLFSERDHNFANEHKLDGVLHELAKKPKLIQKANIEADLLAYIYIYMKTKTKTDTEIGKSVLRPLLSNKNDNKQNSIFRNKEMAETFKNEIKNITTLYQSSQQEISIGQISSETRKGFKSSFKNIKLMSTNVKIQLEKTAENKNISDTLDSWLLYSDSKLSRLFNKTNKTKLMAIVRRINEKD